MLPQHTQQSIRYQPLRTIFQMRLSLPNVSVNIDSYYSRLSTQYPTMETHVYRAVFKTTMDYQASQFFFLLLICIKFLLLIFDCGGKSFLNVNLEQGLHECHFYLLVWLLKSCVLKVKCFFTELVRIPLLMSASCSLIKKDRSLALSSWIQQGHATDRVGFRFRIKIKYWRHYNIDMPPILKNQVSRFFEHCSCMVKCM